MEKRVLKKFDDGENNSSTQESSLVRLCGKCLHPIRKGIRGHICNQTNLLKNITNLFPDKVKERVAIEVIKGKIDVSGNKNVHFATGGKSLKVDIHKAGDVKQQEVSHEHISRMKKRINLSQNQTLVLAEEIRAVHKNRKIVPSNLKRFLKEKNNEFEDIFEYENVDGEEVIYCSNVPEHIARVSQKRGHNQPKLIKIGIDGGQGSALISCCHCISFDHNKQT